MLHRRSGPFLASVTAPAGTATWLGKTISDVQGNVTFDAGHVNGTLKYVENWTQYSANPAYNTGNFVCFKVATSETGATLAAGLFPKIDSTRPDYVTDADGEFIFQISDKDSQVIKVKVTVDGVENIQSYDCKRLVCEEE